MIQFFGPHLSRDAASVSVLGRDLRVTAEVATKMVNVEKDPASPVVEVPIAVWVRAGAYALQEAYFQLPVSARKAWGLGLAGPDGWIALDVGFDPISPLRLTGSVPLEEDLARWLAVLACGCEWVSATTAIRPVPSSRTGSRDDCFTSITR